MTYAPLDPTSTSGFFETSLATPVATEPAPLCFTNFATSQQATLFQNLKNEQFSGELHCQDGQGRKSRIYLYLGRIIYATGGVHPIRRWRRTVIQHCPKIGKSGFKAIAIQQDIALALGHNHPISWDYDVLCRWFKQQKLERNQLLEIIASLVTEILFDLMQSDQITCRFSTDKKFSSPVIFLDAERVIVEAWKSWQSWHRSSLGNHSPNEAPMIKSLSQLKKRTNPETYRILAQLLDGHRSLRDLSVQMNQDLWRLVSSLTLYIHLGFVELVEIEDFPQPTVLARPLT